MAYLSRISIYPVKALDSLALASATILASGALKNDRTFAIQDEQGKFINGKRNVKVHRLRSTFVIKDRTLSLHVQDSEQSYHFQIDRERESLNTWLSDYFSFPVIIVENTAAGFPDDTQASGPTVISTATLQEVASWFSGIDEQSMRLRLRANLEIAGVPAFWEDRLFTEPDKIVQFRIGDVLFEGTNPCQRCVVPSRDPLTGEVFPQFQKILMQKRAETLPAWSERSRFNHFYRLSGNTCVPPSEEGKLLRLGDTINISGSSNSRQIC